MGGAASGVQSGDAVAVPYRDASETLGQRVYEQLKHRILYGHYLPGGRLTLRGIAAELDTSVQPVREALARLASEGALAAAPNRSFAVSRCSRAELDDLHSVRLTLEGEVAYLFAQRGTPADVELLIGINNELRRSHQRADVTGIVHRMQDFGLTLARGSRSVALASFVFSLRLRLGPHVAEAVSQPDPFDQEFVTFTVQINDQLILAFRDQDPVRARDLRRSDLLTLQRVLYQRLAIGLPNHPAQTALM